MQLRDNKIEFDQNDHNQHPLFVVGSHDQAAIKAILMKALMSIQAVTPMMACAVLDCLALVAQLKNQKAATLQATIATIKEMLANAAPSTEANPLTFQFKYNWTLYHGKISALVDMMQIHMKITINNHQHAAKTAEANSIVITEYDDGMAEVDIVRPQPSDASTDTPNTVALITALNRAISQYESDCKARNKSPHPQRKQALSELVAELSDARTTTAMIKAIIEACLTVEAAHSNQAGKLSSLFSSAGTATNGWVGNRSTLAIHLRNCLSGLVKTGIITQAELTAMESTCQPKAPHAAKDQAEAAPVETVTTLALPRAHYMGMSQ